MTGERHDINAEWFRADPDAWLRRTLALHLDPDSGAPYWLAKQQEWGIDLRTEVERVTDLARLPIMPQEDLRARPVEHFVPRRFHADRSEWIVAETGGTTGPPKATVWFKSELRAAFGRFWAHVARARRFPFGGNWLFAGPSGPHIIGRSAAVMANATGSGDPFYVDFDPRWVKRFEPGSAGARRYQDHLLEQAMNVLDGQRIEVIFTTPPVLAALAERMSESQRANIRGIHLGGMHLGPEQYARFRKADFPDAVIVPGYGNTLFGLTLEPEAPAGQQMDNYPPGPRLILDVVEPGSTTPAGEGATGQVLFHRLDDSFMILNMLERDQAAKVPPSSAARELGLTLHGVRDPRPLESAQGDSKIGLY